MRKLRTLTTRAIDLLAQEVQRNFRRRLEGYDVSCHLALTNRAIHELVILAEELTGIFPDQPFEEPSDAQAELARTDEGKDTEGLDVQLAHLKPVHATKKRPRLQGVS